MFFEVNFSNLNVCLIVPFYSFSKALSYKNKYLYGFKTMILFTNNEVNFSNFSITFMVFPKLFNIYKNSN